MARTKRESLHLRLDADTLAELEEERRRLALDPKLVGLAEEVTTATVARMMIRQGLNAAQDRREAALAFQPSASPPDPSPPWGAGARPTKAVWDDEEGPVWADGEGPA